MSTVHRLSGEALVLTKGALETVLPRCTQILGGAQTGALGEAQREEILNAYHRLLDEGLRVMAFAFRQLDGHAGAAEAAALSDEEVERDLVFTGLIALEDPVRPEVPDAVQKCREAGIRVIMITGDAGRTALAVARQRMPRYEAMIRADLKRYGVPEDMVYLALIESGFSNTAVSRSRATGMWQFMKGTAKLYGLRVDTWVDERRDPVRATDAAARHLADLRDQFGSMYLAAAAYNAGAGKVGRGLRRIGDDPDEEEDGPDAAFFRLYDTRYIRRETKDYVPKLIAAALIARDPMAYGFDPVPVGPPFPKDSIVVPEATGLRRIHDLGLEDKIEVVCEDYRSLIGKFDKVVSIGMFEHVGQQFIPVFMRKVDQLLNQGGLGLLHTIGKDVPSASDPWMWKYIIPGNYLPTPDEIAREMGIAGFCILDVENLRLHYARTLDMWADNFERKVEKVRQMFGDILVRMWRLYLRGASAAFKYGELRLFQVLFSKGLHNHLPMTRDHLYA